MNEFRHEFRHEFRCDDLFAEKLFNGFTIDNGTISHRHRFMMN